MKRFLHTFLLAALLMAAGCENELPLDSGRAATGLMVTGFLSCGAPEQVIHVALSEGGTVSGVGEATVRCYVNGVLAASASARSANKGLDAEYHQLPVRFPADFAAGDVVVLEVEAEGYKVSTPQLTVPAAPMVQKADTARVTVHHTDWNEEVIEFTVDMTDRKGEDNWYALDIARTLSGVFSFEDGRPDLDVEEKILPRITPSDPVLLDGNMDGKALRTTVDLDLVDFMDFLGDGRFETFSDQLFRDGPARLVFDSSIQYFYETSDPSLLYDALQRSHGIEAGWYAQWPPHDVTSTLEVHVHGCSQAAYFYLRALRTLRSNGYNPVLTEPVSIPCNIIGGTGFVEILNTTTVRP